MDAEHAYRGRRVLVTGGLGFIGSNIAIRLVELGADVTVVDALIAGHGGNRFNVAPVVGELRLVEGDLRNPETARAAVRGQEVIFALAGQVSHVDALIDPVADLELNCGTQLALLEAWRREAPDARVVFSGSRQQYGRAQYLPIDEEHPLAPIDPNGLHKATAEAALLMYHQLYGLAACSLRLTNTYGPRMQLRHSRQGFVPWFVRLAIDGSAIPIYGDGTQLRDFNEVRDVVDAFVLAGIRPEAVGRTLNLGHPEPVSVRKFAEILVDVAGSGSIETVEFPSERARIEVWSVHVDPSRIRALLGWQPSVGLREGLERMVDYYRAHRSHYW